MNKFMNVLDYYKIPVVADNFKIVCPFHDDKNASLQINIGQNFWYCYGCNKHGNDYQFHKFYQNQLGEKNELKISRLYSKIKNGKEKSGNKAIERTFKTEAEDRVYYRQKLIEAKDDYMGLKTIDWHDADDECVEYMLWRGFKRSTLNKAKAKYTYNDITYPIVFPIMDNGRFKGWVKRTFDVEIEKNRKYLYNTGFRRANTIAGTYRDTEVVMLVEGYMDCLMAKQYGAKNVGAILGWKISKRQIEKLQEEGVNTIISALDNDKCGKQGSEYLKQYFDVIRFPYPEGTKDMGSISRTDYKKAISKINKKLKRRNLEWE